MTTPQHSDALLDLIQERTALVGADLLELVEKARRRLLGVPPERWAAVLDEMLPALSRAMSAAAAQTTLEEGRGVRGSVLEHLDWRTRRLRQFARAATGSEKPSLGQVLLALKQAENLVSDLGMIISDREVGKANAKVLEQADRRRAMVAMWVPERDACARCLAYAGLRVLRPGDAFPGGLSYDPVTEDRGAEPVKQPPLHPRCRCELQLVPRGDSEEASAALKREADRSILRGFALESESGAARRRAAGELLSSGVRAPASVKADARRRLQSGGTFTRPVPDGAGGG